MKKREAEILLEQFVDIHGTNKGSADLHVMIEWLFRDLNTAGLLIKQSPDQSPQGYQFMITLALRYLLGENLSIVDITPVQVVPVMETGAKGTVFDLGETGPEGLLFCLRFLMEVVGIKKVKRCKACGRIIFAAHGRTAYCKNNDVCKNRFNYLENKKLKEVKK